MVTEHFFFKNVFSPTEPRRDCICLLPPKNPYFKHQSTAQRTDKIFCIVNILEKSCVAYCALLVIWRISGPDIYVQHKEYFSKDCQNSQDSGKKVKVLMLGVGDFCISVGFFLFFFSYGWYLKYVGQLSLKYERIYIIKKHRICFFSWVSEFKWCYKILNLA